MNRIVSISIILLVVLALALPLSAQINHGLRDGQGRHVIARGFVVNTNDGKYDLTFNVDDYDRMGVGSIKACFLGSCTKQNFLPGGPSTWAIFSDENSVGTVERKYITDINHD